MAQPDATHIVEAITRGESGRADELMSLVYDDLRAIAASMFARETPGHTLQPTAVVNEAYLRLVDQTRVQWQGRAHFLAIGAVVIRRILIDHARGRATAKRGGGLERVTLSLAEGPAGDWGGDSPFDAEALDALLKELSSLDERQGRVVELRFFAGMSVEEVAAVLGVSEKTVKNDWRFARAWLKDRLERQNSGDSVPRAGRILAD